MRSHSALSRLALVLIAALVLPACQQAYYNAWEKLGKDKRDLLSDRVEEAQESQQEAKEQFENALEQFRSVVAFDGGELEDAYDDVKSAYDRSAARASDVTERIDDVERVARDLFDEWDDELNDYESADLRRRSQSQLRETERRFDGLLSAMRRAESSMSPVLERLEDQTLFLKHNLNARAIASLEGEVAVLQDETADLIREMERAIREADDFLSGMEA